MLWMSGSRTALKGTVVLEERLGEGPTLCWPQWELKVKPCEN